MILSGQTYPESALKQRKPPLYKRFQCNRVLILVDKNPSEILPGGDKKTADSPHMLTLSEFFADAGSLTRPPGTNDPKFRPEHTAMGELVGLARDAVSAPIDASQSSQRALQNDEIAHLAADVSASLPGIGAVTAGCLRASMLADFHERFPALLVDTALNFAGGFALNKLSKSASFGEIRSIGLRNSESALGAEIVSHVWTGAGFNGARTLFDARSWRDEKGQLSASGALTKTLEAGMVGGIASVPGGLLSNRITSFAMPMVRENLLAKVFVSGTSGATAGAMFGGIDALLATGNLEQTKDGFLQGAAVGALSGGIVSGLEGVKNDALHAVAERYKKPPVVDKVSGPLFGQAAESDAIRARVDRVMASDGERLSFAPVAQRKLADLTAQLGEGTVTLSAIPKLNPYGPSRFYSKGQYSANVVRPWERSISYTVNDTHLAVPREYADRLAPVRALRLAAEEPNQLLDSSVHMRDLIVSVRKASPGSSREEFLQELAKTQEAENNPQILESIKKSDSTDLDAALKIADAQVALQAHPLGTRVLPEDLIPLLDQLPNRHVISSVRLYDQDCAWNSFYDHFDDWARYVKNETGKSFRSAASANIGGRRVEFYRAGAPEITRSAGSILDHEQVHMNHFDVYRTARHYDEKVEASKYSYFNDHESEAELESLAFLGPTETFIEAVDRAPVRMSVLARKLAEAVDKPEAANRSARRDTILARADYVEEHALPEANRRLLGSLLNVAEKARGENATAEERRLFEQYPLLEHNPEELYVHRTFDLLRHLNPEPDQALRDVYTYFLNSDIPSLSKGAEKAFKALENAKKIES